MNTNLKYCASLTAYQRYKSHEVQVGSIGVGGENPIRLQSMTTTNTMDTDATVAQSIRMIDAGCGNEYWNTVSLSLEVTVNVPL